MTVFTKGDIPDVQGIDVPSGFTAATATFGSTTLTVRPSEGSTYNYLQVDWPGPVTQDSGLYPIVVVLTAPGRRRTVKTEPIVVEDPNETWHTLGSARQSWPAASQMDDHRLAELLAVAKEQVQKYAPGNPAQATPRLRQAQGLQARNILNATKTDPGGGDGDFVGRPYPLDRFVRELIRPRAVVGGVG